MRDRPHPNHKLEWPGGVVPEWARPQQSKNRFGRKGGKGGKDAGKRERLQKVMAQSGYGSRRNIEILIAQGHLTINGQAAKLGDSVGPGDKVKLDGNLIHLRYGEQLPRVLVYHKPEGEIVTRDDPEKRATVFEKLPKVTGGRWVSVGRLDLNTGGLLLFTTSGELANRMTHPRFEVEREYAVRVMGEIDEDKRKLLLETGVDIEGDNCKFDSIEDRGGEGSNHWYHVVLREGKNREVRKMMEAVGLMVSRLMRVRFGNVALPGHIKRGMFKEMDEEQVQELLAFAGMNEPPEDAKAEDEEDERDSIGNRIDPREARRAEPEIPEDIGNRFQHHHAKERPEPDGNRGQYIPGADAPPAKGKQGPRRPQGAHGKPFFNKKRGGQGPRDGNVAHGNAVHGEGVNGNVAHGHVARGNPPAGEGRPHGQPHGHNKHKNKHRKPQGQGNAGNQAQGAPQPQGPKPQAQGAQPGQGKPGRNRRNKNRNRNRGGAGHDARGEQQQTQQPAPETNREPV